jgi:hypothetical protein
MRKKSNTANGFDYLRRAWGEPVRPFESPRKQTPAATTDRGFLLPTHEKNCMPENIEKKGGDHA